MSPKSALLMDHLDETGCKAQSQNSRGIRGVSVPPTCLGNELCKIYLLSNQKLGTMVQPGHFVILHV